MGLRDDGSLWYWDWIPQALKQVGHDTNWAAATFGYSRLVALKTGGTIWEWKLDRGTQTMDQRLQEAPVRMGTHDD
ncbi:MAG TPA: hypothetical protein VK731_06855 [Candidatus Cybelea sp.]|nr:hypothetical protein [Candidatus Cybelea sp.]